MHLVIDTKASKAKRGKPLKLELTGLTPAEHERRAGILAELAANDLSVIRAMVEGDTARIEAHKVRQAELRAKL